jgi:hypothetical protein
MVQDEVGEIRQGYRLQKDSGLIERVVGKH